jgi:hypothetical protein
MSLTSVVTNHRLLLYCKGDISALTVFAQHSNAVSVFRQARRIMRFSPDFIFALAAWRRKQQKYFLQ